MDWTYASLVRTQPPPELWLQRLGQTCQQYIQSYESSPSQVLFAVGLAYREALRRTSVGNSLQGSLALPTSVYDPTEPVSVESRIANDIYSHCLLSVGRTPGDTTLSQKNLQYVTVTTGNMLPAKPVRNFGIKVGPLGSSKTSIEAGPIGSARTSIEAGPIGAALVSVEAGPIGSARTSIEAGPIGSARPKPAGAISPMTSNILWALGGAVVGYGVAKMMSRR